MEQQVSFSTKKSWRQLNFSNRQKIEVLTKAKHSSSEIAKIIGYSKRTIEREIKQGKTITIRTIPDELATVVPIKRRLRQVEEYSADKAGKGLCKYLHKEII